MKPLFEANHNGIRHGGRKLPLTDFNYHSLVLGGSSGCCRRAIRPSFHTLSQDYFNTEARRYSLAETIVFGSMMAMAAFPILSGVRAMIDLVRVLGGI